MTTTQEGRSPSRGEAKTYVLQPGHLVKVDLPEKDFGLVPNIALMHQVVVGQLAAARQGTHATKTRGNVRGGGRKPYRQKGTGRARQGSTRAPQFNGGGVVHGPHPRDYSPRTPKKMKAAALRGALSARAREGRLVVLDSFGLVGGPKTKQALHALSTIADPKENRFLCVLSRGDAVSWLSLRNVSTVHLLAVDQLNTYDVLISDYVVFTQDAYEWFIAPGAHGSEGLAPNEVASETSDGVDEGVATGDARAGVIEPGDKTSHRSPLLNAAHQSARQQMGKVTSHRSDEKDETIDGWSVSTPDVEYVAFLRRPGHVLVTWPSRLSAREAVTLFKELAQRAEAVYARGEANLRYETPGEAPNWDAIAEVEELRFLRADVGADIYIWRVPTEDDLQEPRFQVIEPRVTSGELMPLIENTAKHDVVELIAQHFRAKEFDLEPLNAVG